jgi:hypothetical protein
MGVEPTAFGKAPAPDAVDGIWLRLRRPFRLPLCGHECVWECYDANRAGCVRCGALHRCAKGIVGCTCPLGETDDGGHACLVTGLCISEVRSSRCEYVDHASFEPASLPRRPEDDTAVYDRVRCVVHNFLQSPATAACLELERRKYVQKRRQAFWRILKARKRDHPYRLPDLCSVMAEVSQCEPSPPGLIPVLSGRRRCNADWIVRQSACGISDAILQIYRMGFRKICQGGKFDSMVIGMLYMMRTGLSAGGAFHLPQLSRIKELLPSETYLNCLGVSNKVICDTENEIKSCIRAFSEPHAGQPPAPATASALARARAPPPSLSQGPSRGPA